MIYVNNAELEKIFGSSSNITFSTVQVENFFFIYLGRINLFVYICAQILNILWQTLKRMKR